MIFIQELEKTKAYKAGYEVGVYIHNHPIVSSIIAIIFVASLLFTVVKVYKKLKNFGE